MENILHKLEKPILTYKDVPYNAALVFNAGVVKYNGKYVMLFRNDYGSFEEQRLDGTNIGLATSDNGIDWSVDNRPRLEINTGEIRRVYDPRITVIDGEVYVCMAMGTKHGTCGGIFKTDDFDHFELISMSVPDNRNMVLFPEKIGGLFTRLERPMPVYSRGNRDRFDMWLSQSPDMEFWGRNKLVLGVEDIPFANDKIGPAAPPIKTDKGWLTTFHSVDIDLSRGKNGWEDVWQKRYTAGICLLDLTNPSKVIGMCTEPILECDKAFEEENGFRTNVVFPGGMILEDTGEVKIYYGASDTVECLATADVNDLLKLCREGKKIEH